MKACTICNNTAGNRLHTAREMMFGFRDQFEYLECAQCGCLQLLCPPKDLSRYYPRDYYSFQAHGRVMTFLRHCWSAFAYGEPCAIGWLISSLYFPNRAMAALKRLNPPKEAAILDVGCGSGHLLLDLQNLGFRCLAGVDPYLESQLDYQGGLTVYKKTLDQFEGRFDVIMLHHAYEHMDNPLEVLKALSRLLNPDGTIILRIPVASSYGWRHYGVNWVNLDAPRHLFLHTTSSIGHLAKQTGLAIVQSVQEADDGVFWASEAYARDIPMSDPRFPFNSLRKRLLGLRQLVRYRAKATELCRLNQSDGVCFYLKRASRLPSP